MMTFPIYGKIKKVPNHQPDKGDHGGYYPPVITILIHVVCLPFPVMGGKFMALFYPHYTNPVKILIFFG